MEELNRVIDVCKKDIKGLLKVYLNDKDINNEEIDDEIASLVLANMIERIKTRTEYKDIVKKTLESFDHIFGH